MMDDDYFLAVSKLSSSQFECKKHGTFDAPVSLDHRIFCPRCMADALEKAIGQATKKA